jgi:branched-chain amino acid transport system permease protein
LVIKVVNIRQFWSKKLTFASIFLLFLLPLILIQPKTYINLTIAGLAMGMFLFLMASGLSIIFGLMDVVNFAHGAFFAWGAYVGYSAFKLLTKFVEADSLFVNLLAFFLAMVAVIIAVGILGIIIERIVIRRVYGSHLFQILVTFGLTIILEEFIRISWGPNDLIMPIPFNFRGSWDIVDINVIKYPIIVILLGSIVYGVMQLVLKQTKVGIIVRAGVENREMVQAMGYNIFLFFTATFVVGAGLAALGGFVMSIFSLQIYPAMGGTYLLFAFIVVVIGGLGSVSGSMVGAMIVGLSYNYVAYLFPMAAVGVNVLMMTIIILIRPSGLFPVGK